MQADHKYRSDIDGLRAVAVLPVVFYHAGFEFFSGGFVGVDVFFVISGFLITSIIAREIGNDTFSLANFYERRARRLFPALFTVIAASAVFASFLLMPWELEDFGESMATTALFGSNFLFFTEAGYFDGPAELKPLLHTWSLAIEEQYYLLFPGVLLLMHRAFRGHFLTATLVLFVASFVVSVWSTQYAKDAAFYLLPSRTWELMLGSLLALLPSVQVRAWVRSAAGMVGLAMILFAATTYDQTTVFPGVAAVLPCLGTGLIIWCGIGLPAGATRPLSMRLLSWQPLIWVGLISYSLYLWHWPVLVFAKHYLLRPLDATEALVLIGVSLLFAYGSWRFIERPFRGPGAWLSRTGVLRATVASMVVLVGLGLWMDQTEGLPGRLPENVARIANVAADKPVNRRRCEGIKPAEFSYERLCRVNELAVEPTFIVWGDSHAMSVMPEIGRMAQELNLNGLDVSSNGCVPLLGVTRPVRDLREECLGFSQATIELLGEHPEITTVILISRWARHAEGTVFGEESGAAYFMATKDRVARNSTENMAIYRAAFEETLTTLAALGKEVVIVGAVPEVGKPVPDVIAKSLWRGQTPNLVLNAQDVTARQANVQQVFSELPQNFAIRYYAARPYFCDMKTCAVVDDQGIPLYFDDNHLASTGARRLSPLWHDVLAPLCTQNC